MIKDSFPMKLLEISYFNYFFTPPFPSASVIKALHYCYRCNSEPCVNNITFNNIEIHSQSIISNIMAYNGIF